MKPAPVTRHFASIKSGRWGARQVHYRRAGSGPVIVLLHQSPLSSRDVLPAVERWKSRYTCIAPDTPGYGLSDPLGVERAEMHDYAEAVIEFLDAIGVDRAAFYGFHTGAMIATAIARRYPQRVTAAVANGYVILTKDELGDIVDRYLPQVLPSWDGAHLAWLWSRMREQTIFFPWYTKGAQNRLAGDVPSPEALQQGLLDVMRSGDHYRVGYRAAFTMDAAQALREVKAPVLVVASKTDATSQYLVRAKDASASVSVKEAATAEAALEASLAFIAKSKPPKAPPVAPTAPLPGKLWQQIVVAGGRELRVLRNTDAPGRTVLLVHEAGASIETAANLARSFIGLRPVVTLDLPGRGESQADRGKATSAVTIARDAKSLIDALDALDLAEVDVVGAWGGSLLALELATRARARVRRLALLNLPWFDTRAQKAIARGYAPAWAPAVHGGHLLDAWHRVRNQHLFWPWYDSSARGAIRSNVPIGPELIQRRLLDFLRAPDAWSAAQRAQFGYPVKSKLAAVRVAALLAASPWDPWRDATLAASKANASIPFRELGNDSARWAREILPFLDA